MINFFHISDLHYTLRKGRERDEARSSAKAILQLARRLTDLGVLSRPLLIITGDLVYGGDLDPNAGATDYDAVFGEFLEPLMNILKIDSGDVYLVPGNHEMDRDVVSQADQISWSSYNSKRLCEEDLHKDLVAKLDAYFNFVESHDFNSVTKTEPRLARFSRDGAEIVCVNGLVGSYSQGKEKGELFVAPTELRGCFSEIPKQSIVLMHHPLSWFTDDTSNSLSALFQSKSVRLMTGHIHNQAVENTESTEGNFVQIHAGASGDSKGSTVGVAWMRGESNAAAVRSFRFDHSKGEFPITPVSETECAPPNTLSYFTRTEAFFDITAIDEIRRAANGAYASELSKTFGNDARSYISPDLVVHKEDTLAVERIATDRFKTDPLNRMICGGELSGKSSFLLWSAANENSDAVDSKKIHILYDFRRLKSDDTLKTGIERELKSFGVKSTEMENLFNSGAVELWLDNFSPEPGLAMDRFLEFAETYPLCRWTLAVRGSQRFMPASAPANMPEGDINYYELSAVTMRTAMRIIDGHDRSPNGEGHRAVVERVFRSIKNLQAPRTIFYVNSLIDLFLTDGSVEPLNRYLLIENLLSDRIRAAHRKHIPDQPIDMLMLEALIAEIAHFLLKEEASHISEGSLLKLIEQFIERKGVLRRTLPPGAAVDILKDSFVLRENDGHFSFLMMSIEDYFLAKHMSFDSDFRDAIMSPKGLLALPSVAEVYVAQNPNDRQRIDSVFEIIAQFENEVAPLIEEVKEKTRQSIWDAAPGQGSKIQDDLVEYLGEAEDLHEKPILINPNPQTIGKTKRLTFTTEERGAVFLQLGSAILGVTRTLDQEERKKIFKRLRRIMLISLQSVPLVAEHLAEGGEVNYRGITIRAEYKGELAKNENRYYLILRTMIHNVLKRFAIWAGSPSFFNAAVELRSEEDDELILAALFAQNIEADLAEAIKFINEIDTTISAHILKDALIRQYVESMMLVPFKREDQVSAIDKLVDIITTLNPPPKSANPKAMERYKSEKRQQFINRLSFNQFIGKLGKSPKDD